MSEDSLKIRKLTDRGSVTKILADMKDSGNTFDELLPMVYDELRRLAASHLRRERDSHTLQPTALVHEAYLRLIGQENIDWQGRAHFFGVAARIMREILIEYARMRNRQKRGGPNQTQIALDDAMNFDSKGPLDVIAVDEALSRLEALDAKQARIVEMKFFGGMSIEEIAEALAVSPATVKREWSSAKLLLHRWLGSNN